jgi:hypothetical protein
MMLFVSQSMETGGQSKVLVFETNDGQVFIRRGMGVFDEEIELTIHEYDQLIADAKAGKLDRNQSSDEGSTSS